MTMNLTVPQKHQLRIARDSMKMHCTGVHIMGGPDHIEAAEIIERLTGRNVSDPCACALRRQRKLEAQCP